MQKDRRVTLSVLLVLLAFLGGAVYLVVRANDDALGGGAHERSSSIGREPGSSRAGGEGGWRHHDWASRPAERGAEAPTNGSPGPDRERPLQGGATGDDVYDPQMTAMRHSFRSRGDAGVPLPFSPVEATARIVDAHGSLGVGRDASCQVRVLPVETMEFNCLVRVVCDGHVLYPNPSQTAGYAPCGVVNGRAISALDEGHTAADGDPLVRVDLRSGTVVVEDRGDGVAPFRATLRVGPTG